MNLDPEQQTSDLEIVQGIIRRESEAFAAFYDRHAATVFALLCRLLGDPAEAEDALQETFWQVWRQGGVYDPSRGSPMAWLVQIARSRGLDRLRQVRRRVQRDAGSIEGLHEKLPGQDATDARAIEQDTQRVVHRALDGLPSEQREAITLAFFGGFTHQEIADCLGAPLGTIKTRIRLGIRKLQEKLQEMGVQE